MGCLKPCYSTSTTLVGSEIVEIELYDEVSALAGPPGFDPVTGQPFLPDSDDDGLGERHRPGVLVELKAQVDFSRNEEQVQDQGGNDPETFVTITLFDNELTSKGLLVDGKMSIRPNDRLLKIKNPAGVVRHDFTHDGRVGVFCYEVTPGSTGEGIRMLKFERRKLGSF